MDEHSGVASEVEKQAVEIVYERENGSSVPFDLLPEPDREAILARVRERAAVVERFVLHDMLDRTLSESRKTPRRPMLTALFVMVALALVVAIVLGIASLLRIL